MSTIIHRSWLVNMGGNPPPDLAYIVSDYRGRKTVTWSEVFEERRVAQTSSAAGRRSSRPTGAAGTTGRSGSAGTGPGSSRR